MALLAWHFYIAQMAKSNKFGTFGGVFVPSILTILGVIMYLRLPYIIGEAGLWSTLGIILMAHIISATTGLSVSSIATDKKVEAGGTYYMISRSLGLPIGGTLGIALFIGLSFSVSLYLIGFSESFLSYWGWSTDLNNVRLTGSILLLAVTTLTFISTSLAIKTQYFIMAAILLSLASILLGNHDYVPAAPALTGSTTAVPLMVLFGIFFPAVTGFEAGVSMSGDLKNPKQSIPIGSILAIVVGLVVYIGLSFFLAYTVDQGLLASDSQVLLKISWIPELVIAGIWGATLSSALGSILGAPRILQATATDKITPSFFAKGYGPTKEPRNALLLTFLIAEAGILIGELDVIARVVSIFFITTYGFLNISATFERYTSADFRPDFKAPGWVSILGALACILVMIQLDLVAMMGAVVLLSLLFLYLKRKQLTLDSGDAWSGVWASLVKRGLSYLKTSKKHSRHWTPNMILFSGNPDQRSTLVNMGKAVAGNLGMLSSFELVPGVTQKPERLKTKSAEKGSSFFHYQYGCETVLSGMNEVARLYGFSGVEPNTILMGWSQQLKQQDAYFQTLKNFQKYDYNLLVYHAVQAAEQQETIDLWWNGKGRGLAFGLNVVRHLASSPQWKHIRLKVCVPTSRNTSHDAIVADVQRLLNEYRQPATVVVVPTEPNSNNWQEMLAQHSGGSDLVIMGLEDRIGQDQVQLIDNTHQPLHRVLWLVSSHEFSEHQLPSLQSRVASSLAQSTLAVALPPIPHGSHAVLNEDAKQIAERKEALTQKFFEGFFLPYHQATIQFVEELENRMEHLQKELHAQQEIPEASRRHAACDKAWGSALFKLAEFVGNEQILALPSTTEERRQKSLDTYLQLLEADTDRFPKKLTLSFTEAAAEPKQSDTPAVRRYKRRKAARARFFKKDISHTIDYRAVAKFYLWTHRVEFIRTLLQEQNREAQVHVQQLSGLFSSLVELFHQGFQSADGRAKLDTLDSLLKEVHALKGLLQQETQQHQDRLTWEYRQGLQTMMHRLGTLHPAHLLAKERIATKHSSQASQGLRELPEGATAALSQCLHQWRVQLEFQQAQHRVGVSHRELAAAIEQEMVHNFQTKIQPEEKEPALDGLQKYLQHEEEQEPLSQTWEQSAQKMLAHLESLPDELPLEVVDEEGNIGDPLAIPVSRLASYYYQTGYYEPLKGALQGLLSEYRRFRFRLQETMTLAHHNTEEVPLAERLSTLLANWQTQVQEVQTLMDGTYQNMYAPVSMSRLAATSAELSYSERTQQGRELVGRLQQAWRQMTGFFSTLFTQGIYRWSEGMLYAKRWQKEKDDFNFNSQLMDLREAVAESKAHRRNLPTYYPSLFSLANTLQVDYWVSRPEEQTIAQAWRRYQNGFKGCLWVVGPQGSGKTTLLQIAQPRKGKGVQKVRVHPLSSNRQGTAGLTQALKEATQQRGNLRDLLFSLPQNTWLILEDIELYASPGQEPATWLAQLEELLDEHSDRLFIVLSSNQRAYRQLVTQSTLAEKCLEIVHLTPFSASEIKELLLTRHRSSGLTLTYEKEGRPLSEIELAKLFSAYFTYSNGWPGVCLHAWMVHVERVVNDYLVIRKPSHPSTGVLSKLPAEWLTLMQAFLVYQTLSSKAIQAHTGWERGRVSSLLLAMKRSGLVTEQVGQQYQVEPSLVHFIAEAMDPPETDVLEVYLPKKGIFQRLGQRIRNSLRTKEE